LINRAAVGRSEHIADAVPEGAKLSVGGRSLGGNFFEPTLLLDVIPNIAVAREETFGSVVPLFRSRPRRRRSRW
jgi:succinate-semialdehyde dehydrogenase / glutarate-semialdehyde dehydrogenase